MLDFATCKVCDHSLMVHAASGCSEERCKCTLTKERLIDEIIDQARAEIAMERSGTRVRLRKPAERGALRVRVL
jgi:hypothetical protein